MNFAKHGLIWQFDHWTLIYEKSGLHLDSTNKNVNTSVETNDVLMY